MRIDYTLYLVTDRGMLKGRALTLTEAVEAAIKGGATMIQLREKEVSSLEFYAAALKIKAVAGRHGIPFIINDRLDIALAADADGLHVGQQDLPVEVARKLLGKGKILGYSVSNVEEAVYGEKCGADYLGAGPVYPTGSKPDAVGPIGTEALKRIVRSVSIPVVAIGGIGADNIKEIKASGAAGVSVISAILGQENIEGAAKALSNLWK